MGYSTGTFIRQTHLGEPFISQMPDYAYCNAIDRSQRTGGRNRRPTVKAETRGASHTAFVRNMVKIEKLERWQARRHGVGVSNQRDTNRYLGIDF